MILVYQVWARGKLSGVPHFSIVNGCGPLLPYSSLKPFIGTREVPVTNCKTRARISELNDSTTCMNKLELYEKGNRNSHLLSKTIG